jgi:HEXXH motif-containing protein
LTITHSLPADSFTELAGGAGDSVVVSQLHEAQLSKHLMLLRVVAEAARGIDPPSRAAAAFRMGYRLLTEAQAADPAAVARLLGLPHIGSWAHECLASLDNGTPPDFGYLAAVAAAAAVGLGIPFEIEVPVSEGRVPLPGLGCLEVTSQDEWVRLSSDGQRLRVGEHIHLASAALVPDDGTGEAGAPHWRGTPLVRAVADGQAWEVLLEIADHYLDRYPLPICTAMPAADVTRWRRLIQAAWELLVRHHPWAAGPVAEGVRVIVPLQWCDDLESAASPAAFGAIATSLPPSAVSMAETLVHEFQHVKLGGLMDLVPLVEPGTKRGYAPWREDPRPMGGILQGVYAFTGIVRFWNTQRQVETKPDEILRASVLYERWRLAIELVSDTLLSSGSLTPRGVHFVTLLKEQGQQGDPEPVSAEAAEIARDVALDNWLSWQLRHTALDAASVAGLAAAFQRGEPLGSRPLPDAWIEDRIRDIDSAVPRSRLLSMRFEKPQLYRKLSDADDPGERVDSRQDPAHRARVPAPRGMPELSAADDHLARGNASAAVAAYRAALRAGPDPAAWIGLALAVRRLSAETAQPVLAGGLPLLFEMHAHLAEQGIHADPFDLAAWFR